MDLALASTSNDEEIEEQRERRHREDDEPSFGQYGTPVNVHDGRSGRQGCEPSSHDAFSTPLISHVAPTLSVRRAERPGREME